MNKYIIIIGIIILIIAALLVSSYINNVNIKKRIRSRWGQPPIKNRNDNIESISAYWIRKLKHQPSDYYIDDITWNDLSMNEVFNRLNSTNSSVGSEYLYAMLHELNFDIDKLENFENLVQDVDSRQEIRERMQLYLSKLGKHDYNMVCDFIFSPQDKKLKYHFIYPILACLPVAALLTMFINLNYGLLVLASSFAINTAVYYKSKYKLAAQFDAVRYITSIIFCCGKLTKLKDEKIQPYLDNIYKLYKPFKKLIRLGSNFLSVPENDLAFLMEYVKITFLTDFISYERILNTICKKNDLFHQLWQELGKLDAAIAVASYRHSIDFYTAPSFTNSNELVMEDIYHPLLKKPVCNSAKLVRGSIITGSNASGKSTFVKAVAINCIFAQTIHTCLSSSFSFKPSMVVTSMAVADNIVEGESYYIAEIKSLKRVLRLINDDIRCICFIDEILKGTNTIERIAASASILKYLAELNCLVLVASHDIELTEILKDIYDNYHFREKITDDGVTFDYKIHNGYATTRNAIKLLEFMGYPPHVVKDAEAAAEGFETSSQWKSYK